MDKKILNQYVNLVCEREEIAKKIQKIERDIVKFGQYETTKDTVKGGEGGIQHFVIEGYPAKEYQGMINTLKKRRAKLEETERRIAQTVIEVEDFIDSIPDSECVIRRIINLFVIDRKSWQEVAIAIGGGNTADSVRVMYERYLKKH